MAMVVMAAAIVITMAATVDTATITSNNRRLANRLKDHLEYLELRVLPVLLIIVPSMLNTMVLTLTLPTVDTKTILRTTSTMLLSNSNSSNNSSNHRVLHPHHHLARHLHLHPLVLVRRLRHHQGLATTL